MLQAIDERLSIWGWLTGTGVKIAVVIDAWGRGGEGSGIGKAVGDADVRPVSRCLWWAIWFGGDRC